MIRKRSDAIEWLEFELLQEFANIDAKVFLRHGGESDKPFNSFNLGLSTQDSPQTVKKHLNTVCRLMNVSTLYGVRQVHGKRVHQVKEGDRSFLEADALVTDCPNHALIIKHADCQAAVLYDPANHALACVHSGWRGSCANIYAEAIQTLKTYYNSKPQNLIACIGPSLGPEHAEFIHYKKELPSSFWDYQCKPNHFDFWAISEDQLLSCGLLPHHIECARICTYANKQDFFSYRRDEPTGRHATAVVLRNS